MSGRKSRAAAKEQLSLRVNGEHVCCAAIINKNWAVTVAYCIIKDPFKEITLCSGSSILYKNCTVHHVIKYFIHENYDSIINDYNIAIIQVTPAFSYNNTGAIKLTSNKHVRKNLGITCSWRYYLVI
ncbi:hypodermin-A-like [Pogonomyrmex barbatus]|uniref:Hypodermin-A-like n=1 Tax=Pogonomyrmex barbatus TaxID=144034 RepID=A0A6I9WEG5_9HYME|nr:hypodermin-A-like [Pogonomyrmex barbatus]